MMETHIAYVGPSELHDGHVLRVDRADDRATVHVRGADGREIALEFTGVTALSATRPEGMLLHGLAELRGADTRRRFFFANCEEWDDAGVEITAADFRVLPDAPVEPSQPAD
jgi:hypothetical protein